MTKHGFYSIVCAYDEQGRPHEKLMMIRARKKEHLENINEHFGKIGDIVETDNTDYPVRIIAKREVVIPLVTRLMDEVDYSNFKNVCTIGVRCGDATYHTFLHSVWASSQRMEKARLWEQQQAHENKLWKELVHERDLKRKR